MEFHEEISILGKKLNKDTTKTYIDLCQYIDNLFNEETEKKIYIIIDGMSGGGKSYIGNSLMHKYNASLFAMDDFFLRRHQRSRERLDEIGGNIDYERFAVEVLNNIINGCSFKYQKFDCGELKLSKWINAEIKRVNIIEGSYSLHPYFAPYYEKLGMNGFLIRAAVRLPYEEQRKRILNRNGKAMLDRFLNEWIPMENRYLSYNDIYSKCDYIIES